MLLGYHDAMVEDMLTRADEVATGVPLSYPRIPRRLSAAETGWWRWRAKLPPAEPVRRRDPAAALAGRLVPPVLLALGLLHAGWARGSAWQAGNRDSLAHWVLRDGASMPPDAASWAVAALLTAAMGGVHAATQGSRSRPVPALAWATAVGLLVRGAFYPPIDLANGLASDYDRVDLAVYSPPCLPIGLGALIVARDLPWRRSSTPARHGANLTTSRPPRSSTLTSPAPCRTLR